MGLPEMGRSSQSLMFFRTAVRVPSKQRSGAFDRPESYPAPPARGSLPSFLAMDSPCTNIRLHCIVRHQSRHLRNFESFDGHLQNPFKKRLLMLEECRRTLTLNNCNASFMSLANPCSSCA